MFRFRSSKFFLLAGLLDLSLYAAVSLSLGPGHRLALAAGGMMSLAVLLANFGFLINTSTADRRTKVFWTLLAASCILWLAGRMLWVALRMNSASVPAASPLADFLSFLGVVPMFAAAAIRPRRRAGALRHAYIDLALFAGWCVCLYLYFLPPGVALFGPHAYRWRSLVIVIVANAVLLAALALAWRGARGAWRLVYLHLLGAAALHALGWLLVRRALFEERYFFGSLVDLPLLASFLWFGLAGLEAFHRKPAPGAEAAGPPLDHTLATRCAYAGILSMPMLAGWAVFGTMHQAVRQFRVEMPLGAFLVGVLLMRLRQRRVDHYRRALLRATEQSLEQQNRLQAQLVLNEKLASLGDLTAGAAHAINNPLAAIIGYAQLLEAEPQLGDRARATAGKIQDQAERTRQLVNSLFGFARQTPAEKALLDLNAMLSSAVALRRSQLFERNVALLLEIQPGLPAVRGDPKLLLQVFYEIMSNAADAMRPAGGKLLISTRREAANIVIEFADSGPGIDRPDRVFDPFYTTKPVGQGTGLGLSLCYGIIQEHGGQLSCRNWPEGGAIFRIELPAVIVPLTLQHLLEPAAHLR